MAQIWITEALVDPSAPLDTVVSDDELADFWLIAAKEVAKIDFSEIGMPLFEPLIGSVFDAEPTTISSKKSALKVIKRLRAMRGHLDLFFHDKPDLYLLLGRGLMLLEKNEFTAEHEVWAEEINRHHMGFGGGEVIEYLVLVEEIVEMAGRKHLQATGKRATQHASRNKDRDEAICAEYECLRKRMSDENARAKLASTHDLSIERIKQIVKAGLPKNL
jgi:hypothetical protein